MYKRRILALGLVLILCLSLILPASAVSQADALQDTASYIKKTTLDPQVGSISGERVSISLYGYRLNRYRWK